MKRIINWLLVAAIMAMGLIVLSPLPVSAQGPDVTLDSTYVLNWRQYYKLYDTGSKPATVWLGNTQSGVEVGRSIMSWDISTVTGDIVDATLHFMETSGVAGKWISCWRLTQTGWTDDAKWTKYNATHNWASPGGDYGYDEDQVQTVGGTLWNSFDITDHMIAAQGSGELHLLFKLVDESELERNHVMASASNSVAGNRPYIEVNYIPIDPPVVDAFTLGWSYRDAWFGAKLTDDGDGTVSRLVVAWGETAPPLATVWTEWDNYHIWDGTYNAPPDYSISVSGSGLTPGTLHRFRAWAVNEAGTTWSAVEYLTTLSLTGLDMIRKPAWDITWDSAMVGVECDDYGGDVGSTTLFWGEVDEGQVPAAWTNNVTTGHDFGGLPWHDVDWDYELTSLTGATTYFYKFRHVNLADTTWTDTGNFTTLVTPAGLGIEWQPGYYEVKSMHGPYEVTRYYAVAKITGDDGESLRSGHYRYYDFLGVWSVHHDAWNVYVQDDLIYFYVGHCENYYHGMNWQNPGLDLDPADYAHHYTHLNVYAGYGGLAGSIPPAVAWTGIKTVYWSQWLSGGPEAGDWWARFWHEVDGWTDVVGGMWWLVLIGAWGAIYAGFRHNRAVMLALGCAVFAFFLVAGLLEVWVVVVLAIIAGGIVFVVLKRPFSGGTAGE